MNKSIGKHNKLLKNASKNLRAILTGNSKLITIGILRLYNILTF